MGETAAEVIHIQVHPGHGRLRERSDGSAPVALPPSMEALERVQAVSKFLLESPPGEINDVLNGTIPLTARSTWKG